MRRKGESNGARIVAIVIRSLMIGRGLCIKYILVNVLTHCNEKMVWR